MLQVLIIFLLLVCVSNAEQLPTPPNPKQLSEYESSHKIVQPSYMPKENEQKVDLHKAEDQLKLQIMKEDTAVKLQKRTQGELAPEALIGPPLPGASHKMKLPKLSHKSEDAQRATRALEGEGAPEPWQKK